MKFLILTLVLLSILTNVSTDDQTTVPQPTTTPPEVSSTASPVITVPVVSQEPTSTESPTVTTKVTTTGPKTTDCGCSSTTPVPTEDSNECLNAYKTCINRLEKKVDVDKFSECLNNLNTTGAGVGLKLFWSFMIILLVAFVAYIIYRTRDYRNRMGTLRF